jgi:hypothetical protein
VSLQHLFSIDLLQKGIKLIDEREAFSRAEMNFITSLHYVVLSEKNFPASSYF